MALESDVMNPSPSSLPAPPPSAALRVERPVDASHSDRRVETTVGSNNDCDDDFGRRDRRSSRMISNWPGGEAKSNLSMVA